MIDARGQAGAGRAASGGDETGLRHSFAAVRASTKTHNLTYNVFARPSEPITWLIANFTPFSANAVTILAGVCGLAGSVLYVQGAPFAAALAFALFFLLDCSDGAIARLKGQASRFGTWLDVGCDRTVLTVAVLVFGTTALAADHRVAAGLCALYFAAHCWLDWRWYLSERRYAEQPPQLRQLVSALEAQRAASQPPRPAWLQHLSRAEAAIRPSPWVCNIVLMLGACLFPSAQTWVFASAIFGLIWFYYAPVIRVRLATW